MPPFTQEYLKNILRYEPETGKWFWLVQKSQNTPIGSEAGALNGQGYHYVWIDYIQYWGAQLAWFYVYGEWHDRLDHADRNHSNGRICNLRPCTRAQNRHNAKTNANNEAGVKGVRYRKDAMKWQARIQVDGRPISLGHFNTMEEAKVAYEAGARRYYGKFSSTQDGVGDGLAAPPPAYSARLPRKRTSLEDLFGPRK